MSQAPKSLYHWAKTTKDGQPGISVLAHSQNVGWTAQLYAQTKSRTLALLGLSPRDVAVLAALHDIGKISEGFLSKCGAWVEENGLVARARRVRDGGYVSDHALVSQYTITNLLRDQKLSMWWALAVGAHHGRLKKMEERGLPSKLGMQTDEPCSEPIFQPGVSMKEYLITRAAVHVIGRSPSMVRLMVRLGSIKLAAQSDIDACSAVAGNASTKPQPNKAREATYRRIIVLQSGSPKCSPSRQWARARRIRNAHRIAFERLYHGSTMSW